MNLVLLVLFLFISQCQSADEKVVRLHTVGIDSANTDKFRIVESLLDDPTQILVTQSDVYARKLYKSTGESETSPPLFLVTSGERDIENVPSADISLLFLSESTLLDETVVINLMQDCFATLKLEDDTAATEKKRPLMILFSGAASAAGRIETLLNEAWQLYDFSARGDYSKATVLSEMDIRILLVPPKLSKGESAGVEARMALNTVISYCLATAGVADDGLYQSFQEPPQIDRSVPAAPLARSEGIDTAAAASEEAYSWALEAASASVERLNKLGPAGEFKGFMKNLVNGAINVFDQSIESHVGDAPSAAVIKMANNDLRNKIFVKMLPFLNRQIQLSRNDIAQKFNAKIADIEVSCNIMTDLRKEKNKAVREFDQTVRTLIPAGPWQTKGGNFEVHEFKATLEEYLDGREAHYKLLGVLSRGRKPIDISFHTMVYHPLGRDARQEPLGIAHMRDTPFFEDDSDRSAKVEAMEAKGTKGSVSVLPSSPEKSTVSALEARRVLERHIQQSPVVKGDAKRKSEFAREMLMFPLSVKNPEVPMQSSGGRRRRRKTANSDSPVPKRDETRDITGPERFIRYDVAPMQEAKTDMQKLVTRQAAAEEKETYLKKLRNAFNEIPLFGTHYYKQPPINYQKTSSK